MKVDFLVGPIASSDEDIVFDTRDYYGTTVPKEEILFDIEDAVKWLVESSSKRGAFALLEPLKGISVRDLFLKIRIEAGAKGLSSICVYVKSEDVKKHLTSSLRSIEGLKDRFTFYGKTLTIMTGNIVEVVADAIVNASNTQLILGSGVSGAIRQKAGPRLQEEMSLIAEKRQLKPGDVVLTGSYDLITCKYIIHAATADGSERSVARAVANCMKICGNNNIASVAFPALGTGTGGLPMPDCARITIERIMSYWKNTDPAVNPGSVMLVLKTDNDYAEFKKEIWQYKLSGNELQ